MFRSNLHTDVKDFLLVLGSPSKIYLHKEDHKMAIALLHEWDLFVEPSDISFKTDMNQFGTGEQRGSEATLVIIIIAHSNRLPMSRILQGDDRKSIGPAAPAV